MRVVTCYASVVMLHDDLDFAHIVMLVYIDWRNLSISSRIGVTLFGMNAENLTFAFSILLSFHSEATVLLQER